MKKIKWDGSIENFQKLRALTKGEIFLDSNGISWFDSGEIVTCSINKNIIVNNKKIVRIEEDGGEE